MNARPSNLQALLSLYCHSPSADLREQLIRLHIGLVRKVVFRICHQMPSADSRFESAGIQGLTKALSAYPANTRQTFSSFAVPYIRHELQSCLQTVYQSQTFSDPPAEAAAAVSAPHGLN